MFTFSLPNFQQQRLAVKLSKSGERSVLQNHPWLFSNSIVKVNKTPKSGDIAIIFKQKTNKVIGIGLYDEDSPIRIKVLHFGSSQNIDAAFFKTKIKHAYIKRKPLLKTATNSYRLLFGENDRFPGFIADVYDSVLVVKLYSQIWLPYLETILQSLIEVSKVDTVVIRLSRQLQKTDFPLTDGQVVFGNLNNEVVHFIEHGVHFSANVIKGHKTGYFLDHRHNRKRVGSMSNQKTVLDVFAYAGGFSVHALANGASEVTSLDISKQALEIASQNALLNPFSGKHFTIAGDAFIELQKLIDQKKTFDVVVIDPPSFAKQHSEIEMAKKKYKKLATLGIQLTAKKGMLVLASCSSRIVADDFFNINEMVLQQHNIQYHTEIETTHDIDHPIGFKEGAYLKTGYYRFLES